EVDLRIDIRDHPELESTQRNSRENWLHRGSCRLHEGAMKRSAYLQLLGHRRASLCRQFDCSANRRGMTRHHYLSGSIQVRRNHKFSIDAGLAAYLSDLFRIESYQRSHRALPLRTRFLHQTPALAHCAERVGIGEDTRGDQRAIFAEAVTRG